MDAIVLLEREDLSSKMTRGQQKLLLKALQSLRPQTIEEATDGGATADWAAAPVEACVSADIAGDSSWSVTAAPASAAATTTAATAATSQIGDVHQHPVGDVYTNMMAEHLRSLQTAACDASRLPVAGTQPLSTRITRPCGLDCRISLRSGSPRLDSGRQADWFLRRPQGGQDPQVYLESAAAGKSSVTYHDIVDFVTKDMIDELVVAGEGGVHDGSQLVVKTGSNGAFECGRIYRVYEFRLGNNVRVTSQLVFASRELVTKKAAPVSDLHLVSIIACT